MTIYVYSKLILLFLPLNIISLECIEKAKRKQKHVVIMSTTILFAIIMGQIGLGWYSDDRAFIKFGSTRESIYIVATSNIPARLHLFSNVLFFGGLIIVDFLMVRFTFKINRRPHEDPRDYA